MSSPTRQAETSGLRHTALYPLHQSLHARFVDFAGYAMPLQYQDGIKAEHLHTRTAAGLFDVSHMGQIHIIGGNIAAALETLVTGDIKGLANYQQRYTLLTNDEGGIIDDLMVSKLPEGFFLVVNAANKAEVFTYLQSQLELTCRVEMREEQALLALQGPMAAAVLERFDAATAKLRFLQAGIFTLAGIDCLVNRCGYTGEDGFEISLDNEHAPRLAELLLAEKEVEAIGLAARDSLRLEAGLCLHGQDIDSKTTPVEAGLKFAIAARYRKGGEQALFPGAKRILEQCGGGTERVLVGLRPVGKQPVRAGTAVLDANGNKVGEISSGGFGPSVDAPVAMGFVPPGLAEIGTELQVEIRNRYHTIQVAELPFVAHRYFKP